MKDRIRDAIAAAISRFPIVNVGGRRAVDLRGAHATHAFGSGEITAEQLVAVRITANQIVAGSLVMRDGELRDQP